VPIKKNQKMGCRYSWKDCLDCPFLKCYGDYQKVSEFVSENREILLRENYDNGMTRWMLKKLYSAVTWYHIRKATKNKGTGGHNE